MIDKQIDELRYWAHQCSLYGQSRAVIFLSEAANTIERLTAEVERLRAALEQVR